MKLDALIENTETKQALSAALANSKLSHAILFVSSAGCGANFAARSLAADYLFPTGGPGAEAVLRGEGSEVLLVQGEGKSGQIPVDAIRAVRADIFHSALSAAGRVVLIRDAHKIAAPAANALLKVLEEPPSGALFILTAPSAASVPPTILSRCTVYPLAPVSLPACQAALETCLPQQADPTLPALLAAVYGGRIGAGRKTLSSPDRQAILQDALAAASAAAARNRYMLLRIFSRYEGRADDDRDKREALLSDFSDALSANLLGLAAPGLPAILPAVAALLLPPVSAARTSLRGNSSPKLTFTALAIHLSRAGLAG